MRIIESLYLISRDLDKTLEKNRENENELI